MASVRMQVGGLPWLLERLETARFSACVTDVPEGARWRSSAWRHPVPPPDIWRHVLRVVRPGGYLVAIGSPGTVHRLTSSIEDAGWDVLDQIVWLRESHALTRSGLQGLWDPVVVARHRGQELPEPPQSKRGWIDPVVRSNGLDYSGVVGRSSVNVSVPKDQVEKTRIPSFYLRDHHELLVWLIELYSPPHGDILDPFCGIGSTGCAAIQLGRGWHGLEVDHGKARSAGRIIRSAVQNCDFKPRL